MQDSHDFFHSSDQGFSFQFILFYSILDVSSFIILFLSPLDIFFRLFYQRNTISIWPILLLFLCLILMSWFIYWYWCHFIHIGSWFNYRPNSCHRAIDTKNLSLHRCLAKSVANWKELSSFIWDIFWNFSATKAN